ncbi:MAG: DUF4124 domain-containing protein [Xanthomonadales bacterium]|nr:DUF4124 domain-containing protein [Xanthomonadales bacterium]
MKWLGYWAALLGLLTLASTAQAGVVYKCRNDNGSIGYQEQPCRPGKLIKKITTDPAPRTPPPPAPANSPKPAAPKPEARPAAPPPPAPPSAPARPSVAYKCTDYKGDSYYSASLQPRRHNVPLYALEQPPPLPPGGALSPEARIWVEDSCVEVPVREACNYYDEQLQFILAQQRRKVGDANKLEYERKRLTAIRNSRCP